MTSKMHIEDRFDCSAKTFMDLLFDRAFDAASMEAIGMNKEIIEEREIDGGMVEVVKMIPSTELPSFMKKIAGGANHYTETRRWNYERMMNDWSEKTGFVQDKIDISGTFVIKPVGEGACTRTVDGNFTVRIPLIGKKIEGFIIDQTKDSFRKSTEFTKKWIAEKGLK